MLHLQEDCGIQHQRQGGLLRIWITHVCFHFVDLREAGAVFHSRTESERISFEAGLRTDGTLQIGECVLLDILYCRSAQGNCERDGREGVIPTHSHFDTCVFESIDHVPPNIPNSTHTTSLYIFEDNAAVFQMINKGRSQNLRHVTRMHRVDMDYLFERVN